MTLNPYDDNRQITHAQPAYGDALRRERIGYGEDALDKGASCRSKGAKLSDEKTRLDSAYGDVIRHLRVDIHVTGHEQLDGEEFYRRRY